MSRFGEDLNDLPRELAALVELLAERQDLLSRDLRAQVLHHLLFFGEETAHEELSFFRRRPPRRPRRDEDERRDRFFLPLLSKAELRYRVARRHLLRFLLVLALSASERPPLDLELDVELALVLGSGRGDNPIPRPRTQLLLSVLLDDALVVLVLLDIEELLHVGEDVVLDEVPRGVQPRVEVDRRNDGLERVGKDRRPGPATGESLVVGQVDVPPEFTSSARRERTVSLTRSDLIFVSRPS